MALKANQLHHLAIIPDGNTRWAKAKKLPEIVGYQRGLDRVVELTRHVRTLGIHTLTFWGLSTENWAHRPKNELEFLVVIFSRAIDEHVKDALDNGVRIVHLGRKDRLPKKLIDKISAAEEKTAINTKYFLNIALDYGGHDELIRATQKIIADVAAGKLNPSQLDEVIRNLDDKQKVTRYSQYLDNGDQPYPFPDFIIRTSGEIRLSGFMPWQSTYSEFYFEPAFFPDLSPAKLEAAIEVFKQRQRRFGGGHSRETIG